MTLALFLFQAAPQTNPVIGFLPLILIFGIFYFLLFLPIQRQKKQQRRMLSELKNGDVVVTSGGIIGSIVGINEDDTLVLRVKPGDIRLQVTRASVASLWGTTEKK